MPVECFFSAPTRTSRAREASAVFGTSAVTEIADGPAGVVRLPRTTTPRCRWAAFTTGGVSSPPVGPPPPDGWPPVSVGGGFVPVVGGGGSRPPGSLPP